MHCDTVYVIYYICVYQLWHNVCVPCEMRLPLAVFVCWICVVFACKFFYCELVLREKLQKYIVIQNTTSINCDSAYASQCTHVRVYIHIQIHTSLSFWGFQMFQDLSLALCKVSVHSFRIWGTSHIRMSHVTHYTYKRVTWHDESCHTCEWVSPCSMPLSTHQGSEYKRMHVWMSHVTYEWVMSRMNESCHVCMSHVTYEWVVYEACHIWWIHVTCMNKSCHIGMSHVPYEWVMSHIWMSHVPYKWVVNEPCHVYTSRHLWISHVT